MYRILIIFLFFLFSCKSNDDYAISEIKSEFRGKVLEKIAVRPNLYTHLKIKMENKDTLIFFDPKKIIIGDSIIKYKNEPFCYIKNTDRNSNQREIFTVINEELYLSSEFPAEWKEKCKNEWRDACLNIDNSKNKYSPNKTE